MIAGWSLNLPLFPEGHGWLAHEHALITAIGHGWELSRLRLKPCLGKSFRTCQGVWWYITGWWLQAHQHPTNNTRLELHLETKINRIHHLTTINIHHWTTIYPAFYPPILISAMHQVTCDPAPPASWGWRPEGFWASTVLTTGGCPQCRWLGKSWRIMASNGLERRIIALDPNHCCQTVTTTTHCSSLVKLFDNVCSKPGVDGVTSSCRWGP